MARKQYQVAVGDRIFRIFPTKEQAVEMAELCSQFYLNVECRVLHGNGNQVKGTPTYMNGKEI